jgi:hypothetical protein
MEILLALAAAVAYGVSDFAGGVLTRRAHVFVVFLLSQRHCCIEPECAGEAQQVEALLHGRAPRKGRTTRPCL